MKIIFFSALLCTASLSLASQSQVSTQPKTYTIKMPSEKILHDRFKALGGEEHFVVVTKIIEQIADKELTPADIATAVAEVVHSCRQYVETELLVNFVLAQLTNFIIEALLRDFPDALKELKEKQFYTPTASENSAKKKKE